MPEGDRASTLRSHSFDLVAMWSNAGEMLGRAAGKPIRVARESVRRRPLLRAILNRPGGAVAAAGQAPIYRGEGRCFA